MEVVLDLHTSEHRLEEPLICTGNILVEVKDCVTLRLFVHRN